MSPSSIRQERINEREEAIVRLRAVLDDETTIYTLTHYGRGETDYVRAFVAKDDAIEEITYLIAAASELRQTHDGIALGGAQYSKALEVADWAWRQGLGKPLDQHFWQEL